MTDVVKEDLEQILARLDGRTDQLAGSTVLIAGGGGFLPSYIVDVLLYANRVALSKPCKVICVDNFVTGVPERLAHLGSRDDFQLIVQDIVQPLPPLEHVDYIVHGASIASPITYRRYPLETVKVNVWGTENLLELSRQQKIKSFLYLSSSETYGDPDPARVPTPEDYWGNVSCTGPRACYDESKRLAESLCSIYQREFGVPVKIIRPFNVYGPRLNLNDGRIIPDLLKNALSGEHLTLYSDGRATRSFCYISDAVTAMLLLMLTDRNGEAFNVGNDEEVSIEHVARQVDKLFQEKLGVRFAKSDDPNYLTDNPNRRCPDLRKTKSTISWQPVVSLEDGIARTVRWYQEAGVS